MEPSGGTSPTPSHAYSAMVGSPPRCRSGCRHWPRRRCLSQDTLPFAPVCSTPADSPAATRRWARDDQCRHRMSAHTKVRRQGTSTRSHACTQSPRALASPKRLLRPVAANRPGFPPAAPAAPAEPTLHTAVHSAGLTRRAIGPLFRHSFATHFSGGWIRHPNRACVAGPFRRPGNDTIHAGP